MLDMHCQMIMDEYLEKQSSFDRMREIIIQQIKQMLKQNNILVTAVEGRVKTEKSLEGKLELKGYKYQSLGDITDIVGVRIITFYADEVDKISSLIEQNFDVDWENSVDKRKLLDPDQFGYMSLHYVCRLPKSIVDDPEHPEMNETRFEIQMRTALQHVWATAYHDTGYKSDVEVPREYIRALSRLAGVLEIADQEFSSIIRELAEYRRRVQSIIKGGKFDDLEIDGDTFSSYISIKPFDRLNERIASINKAEIQPQSMMPYLEVFKKFGFKTLGDIERLKDKYGDDAYRLAVMQIGSTDLDILAETIALQNLCIVYLIKNGYGLEGLKSFYDILYGERSRNISSAKRVIKQAEQIDIVPSEEIE